MGGDPPCRTGVEARLLGRVPLVERRTQAARRGQAADEVSPAERTQRVDAARLAVERSGVTRMGRLSLEHDGYLDSQRSRSGKSQVYVMLARWSGRSRFGRGRRAV